MAKSFMNYFKGHEKTFTNIQVAPAVNNKNLKFFMQRSDEYGYEASQVQGIQPQNLNEKRNKHQLLLASIYNKIILLHLSPQMGEVYIHELDPNHCFKYQNSISLPKGDVLYSIQVVDNMIVIHNLDQKSTSLYDIKLAEYYHPVCVDNLDIDT